MAIRVTDNDGVEYEYEDDGTAGFETEQVTNNLEITTTEKYVVFNGDKWTKVEQDNPELIGDEVSDASSTD